MKTVSGQNHHIAGSTGIVRDTDWSSGRNSKTEMNQYESHPIANIFPALFESDYQRLVESIHKNGLLKEIVLYEGKILDGYHRYRACLQASVPPRFVQPIILDPHAFAVRQNEDSRPMNESRRAMAAARMTNLKNGESVSGLRAAQLFKVGSTLVGKARRILREADQRTIDAIDRGMLAVTREYEQIVMRAKYSIPNSGPMRPLFPQISEREMDQKIVYPRFETFIKQLSEYVPENRALPIMQQIVNEMLNRK